MLMVRHAFYRATLSSLLAATCAVAGCQPWSPPAPVASTVEVGFSPEGSAQALVLGTIRSAQHTLKVAAYEFTSRPVASALAEAHRRGVDVQVAVDEKASRRPAAVAALALLTDAGIPVRTVGTYPILHDKYMIADSVTVETGSYNYTNAAAERNSENALVIRHDPALAGRYLTHWQSRWNQGVPLVSVVH